MLIQTLAQIFALPALASAVAVPAQKSNSNCVNPPVRRDWQTLSAGDKAQYIDAVKCLATKPSLVASLNTTLFDDFPRIHNEMDEESKQTMRQG
jgi:tyrosinase